MVVNGFWLMMVSLSFNFEPQPNVVMVENRGCTFSFARHRTSTTLVNSPPISPPVLTPELTPDLTTISTSFFFSQIGPKLVLSTVFDSYSSNIDNGLWSSFQFFREI